MAVHQHLRPIDKEFEDADDTGILVLSGRNLRQFPNVPSELCDFGDVFELDFSRNRFDRVPAEVSQFHSLTKLTCYHNSIRQIPDEIFMLVNLTHLDLSRNFLQVVPPELCRMSLHSLNLSNNRLVSLPLELGKLADLKFLDLSCNMLPDLPPSVSYLCSLQHLDLHRNELKDLPYDIYKVPLTFLDLSSNYLSRLPISLKRMRGLAVFRVRDNPLESPPTQVCVRGLVHICKYLDGVEKRGSDPHLLMSTSYTDSASLQRRRRMNKKFSRNYSNGSHFSDAERERSLYDEVTNLVNSTFGDDVKKDEDITPTGTLNKQHWTRQQFEHAAEHSSGQSREEYREAAHRLYMEQERQKLKNQLRSSSPPINLPTFTSLHNTQSILHYGTLPKRKHSKDSVTSPTYSDGGGGGGGGGGVRSPMGGGGRCLPGEKHRSGSWNSHMRKASPVLPNRYIVTPDRARSYSQEVMGPLESTPIKAQSSPGSGMAPGHPSVPAGPSPVLPPPSASVSALASASTGVGGGGVEAPPVEEGGRQRSKQVQREAVRDFAIRQATKEVGSSDGQESSSRNAKPAMEHLQGPHETHEGSITPTNETPPNIELEDGEEPHTPKSLEKNQLEEALKAAAAEKEVKEEEEEKKEEEEAKEKEKDKDGGRKDKSPPALEQQPQAAAKDTEGEGRERGNRKGKGKWAEPAMGGGGGGGGGRRGGGGENEGLQRPVSFSGDMVEIQELEEEPAITRGHHRRVPSAGDIPVSPPAAQQVASHSRKKREKAVFKFLGKQDTNFTVRRQKFQMSVILEKHKSVRQRIENLLGVSLADDIGESLSDGVLLCQLVNKLHPNTIQHIHKPTPGQPLSNPKQTINIAAFIAACRGLHIPQELLCSAGDIKEFKEPVRVITLLQNLLDIA